MNSGQLVSFFFYGTLIDPDVRRLVLGVESQKLNVMPAWLPRFTVRYVLRARYPALRPKPGGRAAGIVITGLSRKQALTLDRYEGDAYRRNICMVRLADRRQIAAFVYMPLAKLQIGPRPWIFETWHARDKANFLWASGLNNPRRCEGEGSLARWEG